MKNYFTLERFSLLYDHYAFIDVSEYFADQLFIQISHTASSSARSESVIATGFFPHCLN